MPKLQINSDAANLARDVAHALTVASPLDLMTYKLESSRAVRGGTYYAIDETFPIPPVRKHIADHANNCADCADFHRWRAAYEARCSDNALEPLPRMVAPATLVQESLAAFPAKDASNSEWVGLLALMIENGANDET
ncbi:hypothetical protein [Leifsonia sp. Leaf264]|uniref:hypothetical protein n=1 Tax=Leifsonia sp. Leaf264 TaxID=1736314 RepID=UPI0006F59AFE|nr:hypothetical protein [Leifsonia sp. Leaf264]KQO99690.1 hypothetical protein ASF30_07220 [Leifsonia sp. Leaf264]